HSSLVPLSIVAGMSFMIMADTLSRSLTSFEVPVGIITALIGAPFFIYLLSRVDKEVWGK
ncbi:MAG: iron chelate uptake ABC transporter family permease subunit, partial [Caldimicrobium sp.]